VSKTERKIIDNEIGVFQEFSLSDSSTPNLVGASTAVSAIYLFILRPSTVLALSDAQNLLSRVLAPLLALWLTMPISIDA